MVLCFLWRLLWLQLQYILCNATVLCVEFNVVKTTVDIVQWYCVVCGFYFGYSNSSYSAMVLCLCGFYCVTVTVDLVKWYCVVFGVYCGYSNSRYSAMLMCCVLRLLW